MREAVRAVRDAVQHTAVDGERHQQHAGPGALPEVRCMPEAVPGAMRETLRPGVLEVR
jgi:hypothetical protein